MKKRLQIRHILKNFVAATTLVFGLNLAAERSLALTVISDLDDTIKITHVNTLTAIATGAFGRDVFIGMDGLTRAFQKESSRNRLMIVSGSPKILFISVMRLLIENHIRADEVFLLGNSDRKLTKILELVEGIDDEIILVGDDQENDPVYYQQAQRKFSEKIKAVYIHQVNAQPLLGNQRGFYTAYEVALWEASEGRLGSHVPEEIRSMIEQTLDLKPESKKVSRRISERLVPSWQKCFPIGKNRVLAGVATLPNADRTYLTRVASIVARNCARWSTKK